MTPLRGRVVNRIRFEAALSGDLPAEALPTEERHRLVSQLVMQRWTDDQIAALTRMTKYTTRRIREALDLPEVRVSQARAA